MHAFTGKGEKMKKFKIIVSIAICIPVFVPTVILAMLSEIFFLLHLKKAGRAWLYFWLSITIWWIWISFNVKFTVKGRENLPEKGTKVCYVANHQSMMDIPALFGAGLWGGIIAKIELRKVPGLNIIMKELGCVFIDRKDIRQSLKAILKGVDNLNGGLPMAIYPEGTRSRNGEIAEFKAGALKMATKAKAVIVPVAIQNTRVLLEDAFTFRRIPVYVSILPPIDTSLLGEEEMKNISSTVEDGIRAEYSKLPAYKKK